MKKFISLLLILVLCLSLCSCGEKASAEAVPEETQSQEEYLAELLTSEKWLANTRYSQKNERYTFLKNGYGIRTWSNFGLDDSGDAFQWHLDGNKLLLIFEGSNDAFDVDWLYTFDEKKEIFTCVDNATETRIEVNFLPESRMDEFVKETE